MTHLTPFADDAASVTLDGLTVENGTDRLVLYGSLEVTRDKPGLARARTLLALLQQAVAALEHDPNLPAAVPPAAKPKVVGNPFT